MLWYLPKNIVIHNRLPNCMLFCCIHSTWHAPNTTHLIESWGLTQIYELRKGKESECRCYTPFFRFVSISPTCCVGWLGVWHCFSLSLKRPRNFTYRNRFVNRSRYSPGVSKWIELNLSIFFRHQMKKNNLDFLLW